MGEESSFDIVSQVDLQEVDNAVNQVRREVGTRYDFKGTRCRIEFNKSGDQHVLILADDALKLVGFMHEMSSRGIEGSAMIG